MIGYCIYGKLVLPLRSDFETELLTKTYTTMTDKEVEQENIKKRAIVDQAFNDWYINDIKRCFSYLRVCSVYFNDIDIPHLIDLLNKYNVDIDGNDCVIACITYTVRNNKEQILVYGLPKNGKLLECMSFEVGKPTKYLDLLKSAVDLLTEFYKNYLPRITYDYIGD